MLTDSAVSATLKRKTRSNEQSILRKRKRKEKRKEMKRKNNKPESPT
jgi:hypothetical protein